MIISYFIRQKTNPLFSRVRSRILEQNSPRQRENYFEKFLKILKVVFFQDILKFYPFFSRIAFTSVK
jgi:hypothetical protein